MLKRMFMESHHKNAVMQERMERVMKTLYTMFMAGGGGNAPGLALTSKAPVRTLFGAFYLFINILCMHGIVQLI